MKNSKNIFILCNYILKYFRYYLIITVCSINLTGCVNNNQLKLKDSSFEEIYRISKNALKFKHYRNAIKLLEKLDNSYPSNSLTQQVQLDLIYAYYKANENSLAISLIDKFIRINPLHKDLDYVLYMKGIITEKLDNNDLLNKIFKIDTYENDPKNTIFALEIFQYLIKFFPYSKYVSDANNHIILLKERLARYELSIIKYYNKLGAHIAVINRVKYLLEYYPDTKYSNIALKYMDMAYKKLGLNNKKLKKLTKNNN